MDRTTQTLLVDVAIGCVAGLVATKVYGLVQEALYRPMPRHVKRREERVRPGPSSQVAAGKIAEALGYSLDDQKRELAGCAVHYGLGIAWGPIYGLLRRQGGMQPLGAGVVTGATLSLIVDEGLAPALGFSAPNSDYPALSHVRGFLNHLAYGVAVALTAEALYRVTDMAPERPRPHRGASDVDDDFLSERAGLLHWAWHVSDHPRGRGFFRGRPLQGAPECVTVPYKQATVA